MRVPVSTGTDLLYLTRLYLTHRLYQFLFKFSFKFKRIKNYRIIRVNK